MKLTCSVILPDRIENLPKLVEDIVQTSINTGPRGALRFAQGIQAFIGVGGEWLADVSKVDVYSLLFFLASTITISSTLRMTQHGAN